MRAMPLQLLTWGTITAAVSSAAWLSSTDQGSIFCSVGYRATSRAIGVDLPLQAGPHRAGSSAMPGSSAARRLRTSAI
ncbi:MAG: hypothetical protein ABW032_00200 [Burkholderiaceae bacterium]